MSSGLAVIGAGAWGTALALQGARAGHAPRLWVYEPELLSEIRERRGNAWYLPGVALPERIEAVGSLAEATRATEVVIVAVPSHAFRRVVEQLAPHLPPRACVVSAAKGIETGRLARMSEILEEVVPGHRARMAVLSGPTFALEVAQDQPTAAVLAARELEVARALQTFLSTPTFRLYTQEDVTGVELGGALKNVMAIAAGIADGLDLGTNARAALVTRGLAEITRLGVALGARARTFAGLAGLGDLVLTCTGPLSRNRGLGLALASGRSLQEWQAGTRSVAEGVGTTQAALDLARRAGVAVPITTEIGAVLFGGKPPRAALSALLAREPRPEEEPPELGGAA